MSILSKRDKDWRALEKEIILENFSFYEWMNFEKLLIGLNDADMSIVDSLDLGELEEILSFLISSGHLEEKMQDKERFYKRKLKDKSLLSKIKSRL